MLVCMQVSFSIAPYNLALAKAYMTTPRAQQNKNNTK